MLFKLNTYPDFPKKQKDGDVVVVLKNEKENLEVNEEGAKNGTEEKLNETNNEKVDDKKINCEPSIEKTPEEIAEEKSRILLRELLETELLTPETDEDGKLLKVKIGEVIDEEKHIWFTSNNLKPIINEEGFRLLTEVTGVVFSEPNIIEKQSDFKHNFNQVWIEIESYFPTTEERYKDYGVANQGNCPSNISRSHMPIMALKRAKERAFFKSKTINLNVYSDNEMENSLTEQLRELRAEYNELTRLKNNLEDENKRNRRRLNQLFNLAKNSAYFGNKLIWEMDDINQLGRIANNQKESGINIYVARSKIKFLSNKKNGGKRK